MMSHGQLQLTDGNTALFNGPSGFTAQIPHFTVYSAQLSELF